MEEIIKRLCFGTLATVIKGCGNNLTNADVVMMLTRTIDPNSKYVEVIDGNVYEHTPSISRLINCKADFSPREKQKGSGALEDNSSRKNSLSNIKQLSKDVKIEDVIKKFKDNVVNNIDDDKKAHAIFVLLDIIKNDIAIKRESFKKCFGVDKDALLNQYKYELTNFLASALIYTIGVDNNYKEESDKIVKWINKENIDAIYIQHINEFNWDSDLQILKRIKKENTSLEKVKQKLRYEDDSDEPKSVQMYEGFRMSIEAYDIANCIKSDPTSSLNSNFFDNIKRFVNDIESGFKQKFISEQKGLICQNIIKFTNILKDYAEYLLTNTEMTTEQTNAITFHQLVNEGNAPFSSYFVTHTYRPLHNDVNEFKEWIDKYAIKTNDYRQKLSLLYADICGGEKIL